MIVFKKKELGLLVFLLIGFSFLVSTELILSGNTNIVSPLSSNDDLYEENDSFDQAFEIIKGDMESEESMYEATLQDADWYVIDLTVGENLSLLILISEEIGNWMDLFEVEFYSSDHETPVGEITLGEDILQICLEGAPATGSYYVYLNPLSATFFDYTFIVWPLMEDEYEENDEISQATEIYENFQFYDDYLYALDDDWYKIYLEPEWIMGFDCVYLNYIDFQLEVIGTDGTTPVEIELLSEHDSYMGELSFELSGDLIDTAGFYYIHIAPLQGNSLYMIDVDIVGNSLQPPLLYPITPNPNDNGHIYLDWNTNNDVGFYSIYRELSEITSVGSLTPYVENVQSSYFYDDVSENATYYYALTSNSGGESSSPSNCESVEVVILPFSERKPILDEIDWNFDDYGDVRLRWNSLYDADYYLVFRDTIEILDVSGLEHIALLQAYEEQSSYSWHDNIEENGTYYYAIVGVKGGEYSLVSNSESVSVAIIPFTERSPRYFDLYPSYTEDGYVEMYWGSVLDTQVYYIYRDTAEITDVSGLDPISIQSSTWYQDIINQNGTYYYCVLPYNGFEFGKLSECKSVEVNLIPFTEKVPLLSSIYWHDTDYEQVNLNWNSFQDVNQYLIYRDTNPITDISGMTPIGQSDYSHFTDYVPENGTYYYVILAWKGGEASKISNCESVTVNILPFNERVIQYFQVYPDFTDTGEISMHWEPLYGAVSYFLYRETFEITDISSLTPIQEFYGDNNWWEDNIELNGTYWYALVANNGMVDSVLSDCQRVDVAIIPFSERKITYINGHTELNNEWIYLDWNQVHGAAIYEIFRSTSEIIDISGLEVYDTSSSSHWEDSIPFNGTFYYVVRAFNGTIYTPISSCVTIEQIFVPFNELKPHLYYVNSYDDGRVQIEWSWIAGAEIYNIYRDTSEITDISSMIPIYTSYSQYDTSYTDYIDENGLNYYVVVANNGTINSQISASRSVYVYIIPFNERIPELWCDYDSQSGEVRLEWNSFYDAEMYYIYRFDFQPDGIDGLSPIAMTPNAYYEESLSVNDTFYYIVVGYNGVQLSHVSNCKSVSINILPFSQVRPDSLNLNYEFEFSEVHLEWRSLSGAIGYYIYRESTQINSIEGLDPIGFKIADEEYDWIFYSDSPEEEGHYYYSVVAFDGAQLSLPSYSQDVNVVKNIDDFTLCEPHFDMDIWNSKGLVKFYIDKVIGAESFYIFRDLSPILTVSGLNPIATIDANANDYWTEYSDIVPDNGLYYYAVIANNGTVNSTISDNRDVFIDGIQDVNLPVIDGDYESSGKVTINWGYQDFAAEYLIYREMNNITDLGGLTPYASTQSTQFVDYSISTNDSYYYVVVARNGLFTSEMSNCLNITVDMNSVTEAPVITEIYQNGANSIYINWDSVSYASIYYIYRDLTEITDISGLEPVSLSYGSSEYYDHDISDEGNYYYVVVAGNGAGNSSISNCINQIIQYVPPATPILNPIDPAIDNDGEISLEWENVPLAEGYYIYRCDYEIFDTSKLIPIGYSIGSSYIDWVSETQDYYYVIIAYNQFGFSDMSNVVSVENNRPTISNYAFVSTSYEWIDTSSNPILYQGQDPYYEEIDLSFDFEFYGISFSSLYVSQNGYLSFKDPTPNGAWCEEFPTSDISMRYVISPFMEGFLYDGSTLGTVSSLNASGSCIISWENMEYNGYNVSFQVILYEDGSIKFQYDHIGYINSDVRVGLNLGDNVNGESYTGLTTQTKDFAFKYVPYIENANPALTLPADIIYYSIDEQPYTLSWTIIDPDVLSPIYRIVVDGEIVVNDALWSSGGTIEFDVTGWESGQHLVMIYVEDGYGAVVVDYVCIFVEDIPVILSPGDLDFEEGTSQPQILTWEILDSTYSHPIYNISVDGVIMVENEPWPGDKLISYNVSSFSVGNYIVELVVDDGKGNFAVDAVVVSVHSTAEDLPIITHPEDITYNEGSTDSNIISWTITDTTVNNPTYTIEVDGEIVVENEPWISGQNIQFNVTGWDEGIYTIKITANDGNSGEVVDVVVVTVMHIGFEIPGYSIFNIIGLSVITLVMIKKRLKLNT